MLQIRNLSLVKSKKSMFARILDSICIDIPTKKITLFLGKSGSGKTSILRCISQLDKKYEGKILCKEKNLDQFSQKERCQIIGFVPQAYALFPFMNVLDNCAHPLISVLRMKKNEAYQRVEALLDSLEIGKLKHFYPHELSGGQQQRTSIVRALGLNPTYLLLDEPTSALDPENTDLLVQILLRLKSEGKGIVISSQDMQFAAKILDDVYILDDGKIVENYDFNEVTLGDVPRDSKFNRFIFSKESV